MNIIKIFRDLARDRWYRSELVRALRSGPGAVSLYFSLLTGLISSILTLVFMKEMGDVSIAVFLLMVFLSLNFVLWDLWLCVRNHSLLLLRHAARRSERRMKRLQVESISILGFLDWFYAEPELERLFRREPVEFIETVIKALDRLSETAVRYGSRGRYVFKQNQEPFLAVAALLESVGNEVVTNVLGPKLKKWLEDVPFYDPEGWSLVSSAESLNQRVVSSDLLPRRPRGALTLRGAGLLHLFLRLITAAKVFTNR